MATGYTLLGNIDISLSELATEGQPYERTFVIKECVFPGSNLHCLITFSGGDVSLLLLISHLQLFILTILRCLETIPLQ